MFIAPAFILLFIFSIIPIILSLFISFTNLDIKELVNWDNVDFIGIKNYIKLLSDETFHKAVLNTLFYVILGVPLVVIISMIVVILINYGTSKVFSLFRIIYYAPSVTNTVAIVVVWGFI